MFGERWQNILSDKSSRVALYYPGGALLFKELDRLARMRPCEDGPVIAQGDMTEFLVSLLAGLLRSKPVHVVEKDRAARQPTCQIPEGTCLIKQTVGGSGHRRCQFFSAQQMLSDVDGIHRALDLSNHGVSIAAISPAHSYGLTVTALQTLLNGVPLHWLPQPFPAQLQQALKMHDRVFLPGVPALWKAWLQSGIEFGKVSLAVSAGSPLSLTLEKQSLEDQGLKIHNLYGASECGVISYDASTGIRASADDLGSLLHGVSAITDDDGFLIVSSNSVGIGYDELFSGECFGKGRFRTMDKIKVTGRQLLFQEYAGAGINVASRKLSPAEICQKLRKATGLHDIYVYGIPSRDPERCQQVAAVFALPQSQLTPEFRSDACRDLASWEVPRKWIGKPNASLLTG